MDGNCPTVRMIDLFAGIGGIRMGMERAFRGRARTVFSSAWNRFSRTTYKANWHDRVGPAGDIREVPADSIPDFDILLAGFPCQPFSLAGVSKKNSMGRATGFKDPTQGTLFFDVARIIRERRPRAFLLENVRNLLSHDHGNTFRVIRTTLEDDLGYDIHYRVIDAAGFVPQHRERIYIVGFRDPAPGFTLDAVEPTGHGPVGSILMPENEVDGKYALTDHMWEYLQEYKRRHEQAGHGFGYGLVMPDSDHTRTLPARYYKDGSEILVSRGHGRNPRRLTPRECARLMGYPDDFIFPVSDTQAYRQCGNSVVVPVIEAVGGLMAGVM